MTMTFRTISCCLCVGTSILISLDCERIASGEPHAESSRGENVFPALIPSLIVKLLIDDDKVSLKHIQVVMTPRRQPRPLIAGLITLTGLRDGQSVTTVQVSDARINIEEQHGLVIMTKREVIGALPLPKRIDSLDIRLPGRTKPAFLTVQEGMSVQGTTDEFCRSYGQMPLCQSE